MKAKLQHLIKSEGLTASRFAEMLEIQPAGVSHILAGRNKPSFDLLQKILRRFPKINPDWLLLDSEQMYRDGWNEAESSTSGTTATDFGGSANSGMPMNSLFGGASEGTNFSGVPNGGSNSSGGSGVSGGVNGGQPFGTQNSSRGEANISAGQGVGAGLSHSRAGSSIQKIVIFYADGTFEAYFHGL
ncbi:MAG: helix-turn-helix transcriptional regulator [Rikenellaceae bacterium]|nr:helix-turn-helix transcriptional regulator [Rikenellaceae bacterium]